MGTGLKPNRPPSPWTSRPIPTGTPQGPSQLRETLAPLAPIPSDVVGTLDEAGSFLAERISGGPDSPIERSPTGGDGNTSPSTGGFPGPVIVSGSVTRTAGKGSI